MIPARTRLINFFICFSSDFFFSHQLTSPIIKKAAGSYYQRLVKKSKRSVKLFGRNFTLQGLFRFIPLCYSFLLENLKLENKTTRGGFYE